MFTYISETGKRNYVSHLQNLSGIFTTVINILSRVMAPVPKTAAMYYFIVALLVLFVCFDTYFVLPLLVSVYFFTQLLDKLL